MVDADCLMVVSELRNSICSPFAKGTAQEPARTCKEKLPVLSEDRGWNVEDRSVHAYHMITPY